MYLSKGALCLGMLDALIAERDEMEEPMCIEEETEPEQQQRRRDFVLECEEYLNFVEQLTDFDYYVLDKAEAVVRGLENLDDRQYADTYEMRAWTQFVGDLNLVMLHPDRDYHAMVVTEE